MLARYPEFMGISEFKHYTDSNVSARLVKLADRPEGSRLVADVLHYLSKGYKVTVVATMFDRLFRNSIDAILTEQKWRSMSVNIAIVQRGCIIDTSTAYGRHMFRMMASDAEYEADRTSERIKSAMTGRLQNGLATSKPMWGTETRTVFVPGKTKAEKQLFWISQKHQDDVVMVVMLSEKGDSLRSISDEVFSGKLSADTVNRILKNYRNGNYERIRKDF